MKVWTLLSPPIEEKNYLFSKSVAICFEVLFLLVHIHFILCSNIINILPFKFHMRMFRETEPRLICVHFWNYFPPCFITWKIILLWFKYGKFYAVDRLRIFCFQCAHSDTVTKSITIVLHVIICKWWFYLSLVHYKTHNESPLECKY